MPFGRRVVTDRLVGIEEAGLHELAHRPAVRLVPGDDDRPLGERLRVVEEGGEVDVGDRAPTFAVRTHAAGPGEDDLLGLRLARTLLDGDRPAASDGWHVERERIGRSDVWLSQPAEQDPKHGVGVGGGADRRAGVATHPLLVDDDRRRQPFQHVDVGPGEGRHEPLDERAVGLVDHPLGLGGDRVEHERALPRARHPGEHGQPAFRQLDADVFEVVLLVLR